ncbi:MAG TPA: prolyl oligopeptidase family serine peptidase [Thermoanaerobaculia bacterium]|nr:prolyl oligopeptidase family serine peptidase [Thermoanaerobaculia bacterium]
MHPALPLLAALLAPLAPAQPADGTLLESTPCPANTTTYDEYVKAALANVADEAKLAEKEGLQMEVPPDYASRLLSREEYEKRRAYKGLECRRIVYASDGLRVAGYLWKPKETVGKQLPLVIFNRGGVGDYGKLTPWRLSEGFYPFVSQGFVVLASQYREEGDEFGGADVHDVLNLIPLAARLGYVDMNNIFLYGWSRGGMMTYLALKAGIPANAAAVGSGLSDLATTNYVSDDKVRERSALAWPEQINAPLLILAGTADWRAKVGDQALPLAARLQKLGKPYQLIIYSGDDHGLSLNKADAEQHVIDWFRAHVRLRRIRKTPIRS